MDEVKSSGVESQRLVGRSRSPLNCPPGDTIEEEKYMKQRKTSRNWGVVFLFVMWVILLLAPGAVYGATSGDGSTTFGSVFEITP